MNMGEKYFSQKNINKQNCRFGGEENSLVIHGTSLNSQRMDTLWSGSAFGQYFLGML